MDELFQGLFYLMISFHGVYELALWVAECRLARLGISEVMNIGRS